MSGRNPAVQCRTMESVQVRTGLLGALKHYVLKAAKGYAKNLRVEVYDVILVLRASQEEMLRKDQWGRLDMVLRAVDAARPEQPMTFTGLLSVNQTHGAVFYAGAKTALKQIQKYKQRLEELNRLEKMPFDANLFVTADGDCSPMQWELVCQTILHELLNDAKPATL